MPTNNAINNSSKVTVILQTILGRKILELTL